MFPHPCTECNVESVLKQVIELGRWLTTAAAGGTAEHLVERHLFTQMLAMGAKLHGEFFASVGPPARAGRRGDAPRSGLSTAAARRRRWPRRTPASPA